MFLKSVRILNFFISLHYGYFWLCDTKTFIFKNGLFLLCFVILKLIFKNISNSFYKGIGGYFAIIPPLTPLRSP
ncbi:hypothetical protein HMPREF1394_01215 [Helicobacter pylori GAM105Ai]|nr:hypothetical protein HMPREF1394_01215 [Helicobacter pylori GAM105Ai]